MRASIFIALLIAATGAPSLTASSVHNVGNFSGWTLAVNYSAWASTKKFSVGDIIVFKYNSSLHDVLELEESDFDSCNVSSPISVYSTGNDSIIISRYGHSYFACGFSGHCALGQKLDIHVLKHRSSAHHGKDETNIKEYVMVVLVLAVIIFILVLRFVIFVN